MYQGYASPLLQGEATPYNYLPSFLMGNAPRPPQPHDLRSSSRRAPREPHDIWASPGADSNLAAGFCDAERHEDTERERWRVVGSDHKSMDLADAPPNASLFEMSPTTAGRPAPADTQTTRGSSSPLATPSYGRADEAGFHLPPASLNPAFVLTPALGGKERLDDVWGFTISGISGPGEAWVTVFGFPAASLAYVLQQCEGYGDLVNYEAGLGNWVNVQYASRLQAQRALSKNARLLGDGLIIGMVPTDQCPDARRVQPAQDMLMADRPFLPVSPAPAIRSLRVHGSKGAGAGAGAAAPPSVQGAGKSVLAQASPAGRSFFGRIFELLFGW